MMEAILVDRSTYKYEDGKKKDLFFAIVALGLYSESILISEARHSDIESKIGRKFQLLLSKSSAEDTKRVSMQFALGVCLPEIVAS